MLLLQMKMSFVSERNTTEEEDDNVDNVVFITRFAGIRLNRDMFSFESLDFHLCGLLCCS